MLSLFWRFLFPSRYESPAMLSYYVRAHYGPYLKKDPTDSFEPFCQAMIAIAREYIRPETRALDVGCGTGRLVFEYARLGAARSCGTETSAVFLDFCDRLNRGVVEEISYPVSGTPATFLQDDICASTLPDNSFDFISCLNVIDRVSDPRAAIASILRILSPGGIAIIADPYDWELSPAPRALHVSSSTELLSPDAWKIVREARVIYRIPTGKNSYRDYDCHVVVAQKL